MERVQVLIDRLTEQRRRNETAAQLLVTVQLLQQELLLQQQQTPAPVSKKVSVIMPASAVTIINAQEVTAPQPEVKPEDKQPEIVPQPVPVVAFV